MMMIIKARMEASVKTVIQQWHGEKQVSIMTRKQIFPSLADMKRCDAGPVIVARSKKNWRLIAIAATSSMIRIKGRWARNVINVITQKVGQARYFLSTTLPVFL